MDNKPKVRIDNEANDVQGDKEADVEAEFLDAVSPQSVNNDDALEESKEEQGEKKSEDEGSSDVELEAESGDELDAELEIKDEIETETATSSYSRAPSIFSTMPCNEPDEVEEIDKVALERETERAREDRAESWNGPEGAWESMKGLQNSWAEERHGYKKVITSLTQRVEDLQGLKEKGDVYATESDWNEVS